MREGRRVDAHIHFWKLDRGDYTALSPDAPSLLRDHLPDELAPLLRANAVDDIVVVQAAETVAETRFTLGLAARYPFIAGVVGWIDPTDPRLEHTLEGFKREPRLKGFRPVRDDNRSLAWLAGAAADPGLALLARRGYSLDVLVQHPDETALAADIAGRRRDLPIVLDHCGKPDIRGRRMQPWADDIARVAERANVFCKLSGLLNCAAPDAAAADIYEYAAHVLRCFGPERVMWASDWPPLTLAADYGRWRAVSDDLLQGLDAPARAQVLGGAAARFYRL